MNTEAEAVTRCPRALSPLYRGEGPHPNVRTVGTERRRLTGTETLVRASKVRYGVDELSRRDFKLPELPDTYVEPTPSVVRRMGEKVYQACHRTTVWAAALFD